MLQQQDVLRQPQRRLHDLSVRGAVEEEVRRALDPDRALAVTPDARPRGLAGELAEVLRAEVAAELGDQEARPCAGARQPLRGGR